MPQAFFARRLLRAPYGKRCWQALSNFRVNVYESSCAVWVRMGLLVTVLLIPSDSDW
jgi:hypothetical protein